MSFIVVLACRFFTWGEQCVLLLDRTNWKWGKTHINILVLSIEHLGIGIPIFWTVLKKGGASSTKDRTRILKRVIKAIGPEKIRVLLADREFIGEEWFCFLIKQGIPFIIRIKQNSMAEGIRHGYPVPISTLLGKMGRRKAIENYPVVLWGHCLLVSVEHKKEAKEPMIVVSNREFTSPLKLYRWRWGIESLFECLKTRGFRMEETHMTDPAKIEKLLFILAIAVCWAYKIGELQARKAPITVKRHGRKLKSIFRLGLDLIRRALFREDESFLQELTVLPYLGLTSMGGAI
jgi:transposase